MKLSINFSELLSSVRKMGIKELVPFEIDLSSRPIDIPVDPLTTREGKEVPLNDITIESGTGILTYQGKQILLFIPDHGAYYDNVINGINTGNKFHIADCQKLDEMRKQGRFNRYKITENIDGYFEINDGHYRKSEVKLYVCKYCLQKLNYKNYTQNRNEVFNNFDLKEFFEYYQSIFKNLPEEKFTQNIGYSKDWPTISRKYREYRNYCCEECDVNLSQYPYLLEVHHKNGIKQHNSFENLQVLCRLCHIQKDNHHHMTISDNDKNLILSLRK